MRNQVYCIYDEKGIWHESTEAVSKAFLFYYEKLLISNEGMKTVNVQLIREGPIITVGEVKKALMSISGYKAPKLMVLGLIFIEMSGQLSTMR